MNQPTPYDEYLIQVARKLGHVKKELQISIQEAESFRHFVIKKRLKELEQYQAQAFRIGLTEEQFRDLVKLFS